MEDVVGIRVVDKRRGEVAVLSWGRMFDPVDPAPLLARLRKVLPLMGFDDIVEISLCSELAELQGFAYFYEGIIEFSAQYAIYTGDRNHYLRALADSEDAFRTSLYLLGGKRQNTGDLNGHSFTP